MSLGLLALPPSPPALAVALTPPAPPPPLAALAGNRCGHNPALPRLDRVTLPADANHARPTLITKAIARVVAYYAHPREACWDDLSQNERRRRLERQLQAAGGPDSDAGRPLAAQLAHWRQQRSERREGLVAVLKLLLAYTDIATLTVAIPRGGDWLGLSAPWISQHTGLSRSRVKRALATLDRSRLLTSTGQGRHFDRRRRCWLGAGWGPVRRFSFRFIRALGLNVSWQQAKQKAHQRARAASRPAATPCPSPAAPEAQRTHARALRQSLSPTARPAADSAAQRAATERNRRLAELAAAGLSLSEIRERLNRTPQAP